MNRIGSLYLRRGFRQSIYRRILFLNSRVACLSIVGLFLLPNILDAGEAVQGGALSSRTAVEIAVRDNPNLAEVRARYEALAAIPSQVGSLPDPGVSLSAMNFPTDTFDRNQEPMTQVQLGISQAFPFPGKLELREQAARYDARAAAHSVDEARLQLIRNVKNQWWQLYYLDRALDTVDNNQALLRQSITVAKTKYETGKGLQQDVLLAQLELSRLMDQKIQLRALRRHQTIQLNVLMDRPANGQVVLPENVHKVLPDLAEENILYLKAESARPRLGQIGKQIDAAQSRLDLARRDYYPDFTLAVAYGERAGDNPLPRGGSRSDFLSVMVGVKIPLYASRKQSNAVAQKRRELQQNRYALLDEKGLVMAAISLAATDYRRARAQLSLFESGIVPQARQTVESMLGAYQVDKVDFLNLVRSQLNLFNYELRYWQALTRISHH